MTAIDFVLASPTPESADRDPVLRGTEPLCLPLVDAIDAAVVGGKAYALARMMRAGVAVPDGAVLTTHALDAYLSLAGREEISDVSAADDARLPSEVSAALVAHVSTLLAQGRVVVRSSAIGEDGASESFAGQLDSILRVHDIESLERAVFRVWASLWSNRVAFYRRARGLPVRGMGVVIQRQVDARTAGVLFTSTSSGEMLVEYGQGLADKLVAGEIDPARAAIDRRTAELRSLNAPMRLGAGRCRQGTARRRLGARDGVRRTAGRRMGDRSKRVPVRRSVATHNGSGLASVRRACEPGNGSTSRVVERQRQRELPAADLAAALLDRVGGLHALLPQSRPGLWRRTGSAIDAMEPAFRQIIGAHGARMYYNLTSIHSVLRLAPFGASIARTFDTFVGADGPPSRRGRPCAVER